MKRLVPWLALPALGALASWLLGQDANWDLANYHLYNAWAALNARWTQDLAPAGFQSYFNPLLDLPHFGLTQALAPGAVAAVMGAWHALALAALWLVVRDVLGPMHPRMPGVAWALVAAAACLPLFVSELGSTMGDASTAVLVLLSLHAVLRSQGQDAAQNRPVGAALLAGVLIGTAVGLKLTNAPYALGVFGAALTTAGPWPRRARQGAALVAGGALALALVAGPWMALMWHHFGNPLFPQFNAWFGAPLADAIVVADSAWGPRQWWEWLLWPWVMTLQWRRYSETALANVLWPLLQAALVLWAVGQWRRRGPGPQQTAVDHDGPPVTAARALAVFMAVSFLGWLLVFAVGRYLLALELLLPLAFWLLLHRLAAPATARRRCWGLLSAAVLVGWLQGPGWGRVPFAERSYTVQRPPQADKQRMATVLLLGQPQAWMLPHLPPQWRYAGVGGNFPESSAYRERVRSMLGEAPGAHFAILPAEVDGRTQTLERVNHWLAVLGVGAGDSLCQTLHRYSQRSEKWRQLRARDTTATQAACAFELAPQALVDVAEENRRTLRAWQGRLAPYGVTLHIEQCNELPAAIGRSPRPYLFCPLLP